MSGIRLDSDLFDDVFLESPFEHIFVLGNIFYSGSIFEYEELFHKQNGFIDEQSVPHDSVITQSKICFSHNPIVRNLIESSSKMDVTMEDMIVDVVHRMLMSEYDYILVASHRKWGEHESDSLVQDVALHPNLE